MDVKTDFDVYLRFHSLVYQLGHSPQASIMPGLL